LAERAGRAATTVLPDTREFKPEAGSIGRVSFVLGRRSGDGDGPSGVLGHFLARDGSHGARVRVDLDGPHAALVVGKRGAGKSYTAGVLAEALADADGVAPVVVDPMGVFAGLADCGATVVETPTVAAGALSPRAWCDLLSLSPEGAVGGLVWAAATAADTLAGMREAVDAAEAPASDRRAAANHLRLAASWGVFDPDGLDAEGLVDPGGTVLDGSGLAAAPLNAVVRTAADALYRARVEERLGRLPWLLVDEAHALFGGVAGPGLERLLTRGRAPGVSLVAATQRPSALPAVAVSQADLLVAHHLASGADIEALRRTRPTYLDGLSERLPDGTGEALVVDEATESAHTVTVRERRTPHGGDSPSASALSEEVG
jgi:hypothetical protein